jgi:hypothetical protein
MKAHWKELILALAISIALWFNMSGTEIIESQMNVRIEYKGIPDNVTFQRDGLVGRVSVRVRGPSGQIRSMIAREHIFSMNLASLQPGTNVLPINIASEDFFGPLQVISVNPPSLQLEVDLRLNKEVPLKAVITGTIPQTMLAETSFTPDRVTITGPAKTLEGIEELAVSLELGETSEPGTREFRNQLALPEMVTANPSAVAASVRVDLKRTVVKVSRTVQATAPDNLGISLRPDRVQINVAMPQALAGNAANNKDINAFVYLAEDKLGTHVLPVQVNLPEGALLVGIEPKEILVTLEQKNHRGKTD